MTSPEDVKMQSIIQESLDAFRLHQHSGEKLPGRGGESLITQARKSSGNIDTAAAEQNSDSENPTTEERQTLDDCIENFRFRRTLETPLIRDPDGDTYIFIDPPQKQLEMSHEDFEQYKKHYEHPITMKSDKLRAASTVFEEKLGPTNQFRELRRRNLVNKLPSPIKYVLDLTPPSEGEQALWAMTLLCCSEGVRLWHHAQTIWRVSATLTGGEEDFIQSPQAKKSETKPDMNLDDSADAFHTQFVSRPHLEAQKNRISSENALRLAPLEYTPVRHRSAIERVLAAINGADPKLDSAVKVWTSFGVARFFEIGISPLTGYIMAWVRAFPNSYFLEVLPEISLQIGDGLQSQELTRDAFAILVGEEALDNLVRARSSYAASQRQSTFGRKKTLRDLPDPLIQRVEYASKRFIERIQRDFETLVNDDMHWLLSLPEVQNLTNYSQPELQHSIEALKSLLKDYVRGSILTVLYVNYYRTRNPDLPNTGGEDLLPRWKRTAVWRNLLPHERPMTRTFWEGLHYLGLFQGATNLTVYNQWCMELDMTPSEAQQRMMAADTYRQIETIELKTLITSIRTRLASSSSSSGLLRYGIPGGTMPFRPRPVFQFFGNEANRGSSDHATRPTEPIPIHRSLSPLELQDINTPNEDHTDEFLPMFSEEKTEFFNLEAFFSQCRSHLQSLASSKLQFSDSSLRQDPHELGITNTLVCLGDSEWKYLPLWAGGNDDGTSGVFDDEVPFPSSGFSTAGPHIHTGSRNCSESDYDLVNDSSTSSWPSKATDDGFSNNMLRHRVYSADSDTVSSKGDSSFTMLENSIPEDDVARGHRQIGDLECIEVGGNVRSLTSGNVKCNVTLDDEDYSDLFNGDDNYDDEEIVSDNDDDDDSNGTETGDLVQLEESEEDLDDTVMV